MTKACQKAGFACLVEMRRVQICITRGTKFDGSPCRYYKEVDYVSEKKLKEDAALFLADIISGKVTNSDSTTLNALW